MGKLAIGIAVLLLGAQGALARAAFSCAGFALLGGAQLVCSHADPGAPTQACTFSWALMRASGEQTVVQGSFLLTPGLSNATVFQGGGFSYALSSPIVLCQASGAGN